MAKKIVTEVAKKPKVEPKREVMEPEDNPVENLTFMADGNNIVITADAFKRLRPSRTGRTMIVASTGGLRRIRLAGRDFFIVVSIATASGDFPQPVDMAAGAKFITKK